MLPNELKEKIITLPETDKHTIVIVTGPELRHQRFSHRIQKEFGDLVVAWYELDTHVPSRSTDTTKNTPYIQGNSKAKQALDLLTKELPESLSRFGIMATLKRMRTLSIDVYYRLFILRHTAKAMAEAEKKIFGAELIELKRSTKLKPIKINPNDIHSAEFINEIKTLDPYFFLTLAGPLYRKPLLDSIRGAAINQHAGHSPLLKGSNTIHWALYHRNLSHVSNTVHITTTGADAGEILRRSNPCMFPKDDLHTVFFRSVALGTELMIESVQEIIADKKVMVFKQPKTAGKTYLNKAYNLHIAKALIRDFKADWLRGELNNRKDF